ncbi:scoloptoxin SSD976-like [Leguminivora glycinivorella]|uniref:scoloptoxin SSD976-like n=1 Tax=Leguminivora glycinivorella TaxID=1035111 RepID=UPI00200E9D83|nr:scoloptoxin SSD976-like [Leguminivora glycinivorella]
MAFRVLVFFTIIGLAQIAQCKLLSLSCQQIHQFVDGHNSRRLEVANGKTPGQPSAEKMKSMIWDEELATKAANWASTNPSGHNPDRTVGSGKYQTGENLYWYMTSDKSYKLNVDNALKSWFEEYKDYTYSPMKGSDFTGKKQIGHYTQMVWSDSTHVGCAVAQNHDGHWNKFTVVCNYGPAGNWMGQVPYKSGHGTGKLVCGAGDCSRQYGSKC